VPALAAARAAHRPAPPPRGDGRGRARVRERARLSAGGPARAAGGRAAAVHADDRGARLPGPRRVVGRAGGQDRVLERLQGRRGLVGRAASLLSSSPRITVGAVLAAALIAWYELYDHIPDVSTAVDVTIVGAALLPATFALVWLALPLRGARGLLAVAGAVAVLAAALYAADAEIAANFAKLAAASLVAFAFL